MSAPDQPGKPARVLTTDEVRAELARIRPNAAGALKEAIDGHAARSREDPRELLNEAIQRALTTRAIPVDVVRVRAKQKCCTPRMSRRPL